MMTLQLPPALEGEIRYRAAQRGISPTKLALEMLAELVSSQRDDISPDEAELVRKIFAARLSVSDYRRMKRLSEKMEEEENITPEEHTELMQLCRRSEERNAERLTHLAELAGLRGISLNEVMQQLGLWRSK